jgi:hypothetical protein
MATSKKTYAEFLNNRPYVVNETGVWPCSSMDSKSSSSNGVINAPTIVAAPSGGMGSIGGGVAAVLNKRSYNKNKNKNKNKFSVLSDGGGLTPTAALLRLHRQDRGGSIEIPHFPWARLDIKPPPGPDYSRLETQWLFTLQQNVEERGRRLPDIEREATLDVSSFTRPLGIESLAGYPATENCFQDIIKFCEYVGLYYKGIFARVRPNQLEPRLRPLLPNPAHEAYPSNHAFQCFSIAFAMNTILPEHPVTDELSRIALNVAQNREWAGLHYPSDTQAGRDLARRFSAYLADALKYEYLAVQAEWL